ncbi:Mitochondrial import inner membrane translocase subunit tim8 [Elasticomyces elasticus]|nr:Mitochondrial import inner membrane translocase subunit tim8 [Elasticomyces elasticus]KAK4931030.1 Mitochondrial import inner membrane translocase subunit tim8 [Elasticomyces elasticus]KAK5765497.1 Mitochondrial import inner membrane translocase subunit tim8 [Elasticomyces elasticus]
MAIKRHSAATWCILLYLLALFITGTQSRDTGHGNSLDFHAVNGTVQILKNNASQDTVQGAPFVAAKWENWPVFNAAIESGDRYINLLECRNTQQSFWTDRAALFDNGWVESTPELNTPPAGTPSRRPPYFDIIATVNRGLGISDFSGKLSYWNWLQQKTIDLATTTAWGSVDIGTAYGTTKGSYANLLNPPAGLLICENNFSPAYMAEQNDLPVTDIPPLNRLSDVLWLQWKDAVAFSGQADLVSNVKWIWRHHVVDAKSEDIIDSAISLPDEDIEDWPGKTYDMSAAPGTQERRIARALLGSPNGVGVAHFLSQHRAELGFKTVEKVQLFNDEGERHMLFHIMNINENDVHGY